MSRIPGTLTAVAAVIALDVSSALAQDSPAARTRATELSRAWALIGTGDYARAEQAAAAQLRRTPADHAALVATIAASVGAGKPTGALDTYEQWLQRTRHEDLFVLQPIAAGTLVGIAIGADAGAAVEALSKLAASDPDAARSALARRTDAGPAFDGVRAALGDKDAITRLTAALTAGTSRERLLALRNSAGVAEIPAAALNPLLSDPAPPVRAAAAESIARLQGAGAIATVRPLLDDPDGFVRASAAVALGRLGDAVALEALTRMLSSDAGDTVAMAATVLKERGADITGAADRILADPNPLTRLSAIPLLPAGDQADMLLSQAASDPNPVIRARAGELARAAGAGDLATLRRLLRDASAEVRLNAAGRILGMAGGQGR